ncbi:MAG: hypothetical protein A2X55_10850 [Nitrospirae bacterium GWB2_47_37]|nr:MAG: hypothetical protein A2X55_10850 [Nitrospirae bacterium GWB2_47_37]HAK87793.1 hypothetical protein [Nitrospiraceae bacterium]
MLKISMRLKAIIVILSILLSIFAPVSFEITFTDSGRVSVIATLDVCHAKSPMSPATPDMPVINESQCASCIIDFAGLIKLSNPHSRHFLITFQKEQPPRS